MSSEKQPEMAARVGRNLRAHRRAARLSQEELGLRASLHRTEITVLERGERLPRIDTVVKLAGALSISVLELLDGIEWEPDRIQRGGFVVKTAKHRDRS